MLKALLFSGFIIHITSDYFGNIIKFKPISNYIHHEKLRNIVTKSTLIKNNLISGYNIDFVTYHNNPNTYYTYLNIEDFLITLDIAPVDLKIHQFIGYNTYWFLYEVYYDKCNVYRISSNITRDDKEKITVFQGEIFFTEGYRQEFKKMYEYLISEEDKKMEFIPLIDDIKSIIKYYLI